MKEGFCVCWWISYFFSSDCFFFLSNFVKMMLHGKFWDACFDLINKETIEYWYGILRTGDKDNNWNGKKLTFFDHVYLIKGWLSPNSRVVMTHCYVFASLFTKQLACDIILHDSTRNSFNWRLYFRSESLATALACWWWRHIPFPHPHPYPLPPASPQALRWFINVNADSLTFLMGPFHL